MQKITHLHLVSRLKRGATLHSPVCLWHTDLFTPEARTSPMSDRSLRESQDLSGDFEKTFLVVTGFKSKIVRLFKDFISRHTDWAVGNNTNGYISRLLWMFQFFPRATRKKFISFNCMPWIVFVVCAECRSLGAAALKGRLAKTAASWKCEKFSKI